MRKTTTLTIAITSHAARTRRIMYAVIWKQLLGSRYGWAS
jgi:hypothetical protein